MLSDPSSAWTAKANKRVQFGYGLNYLIDTDESGHRRDPPSHGSCAASIGGVSVEADAPIWARPKAISPELAHIKRAPEPNSSRRQLFRQHRPEAVIAGRS